MTIAFFDCFSGISGDMILGALVDLGLDIEDVASTLSSLDLEEFRLEKHSTTSGTLSRTARSPRG